MSGLRRRIGSVQQRAGKVVSGTAIASEDLRVAGLLMDPGTPLIGVPGLPVEVSIDGDVRLVEVTHTPDPSRPDAERLRELTRLAEAPQEVLVAESPVALARGELVPLPCETELDARFEQLAQVCAYPQARLTRREEIVSLQRARRISPRGVNWLGSHPGAWAGRRGRGPVPSRVLAEQPHSLVDIYENRVVATLVDTIDRHLRGRIREIEQDHARLEEREMAAGGSWRMRDRIANLWAESWTGLDDVSSARGAAGDLLDTLRSRLQQVRALRHRPGYRDVPPRYRTVRSLRLTNIFRGDDRYQDVARLWHSFGTRERQSPAEKLSLQLETMRGHEVFVRLLVHRGIEAGLAGRLLDPLQECNSQVIERRPDRSVRVNAAGAPSLDVFPLFCAGDPQEIGELLGDTSQHVLAVVQPPADTATMPLWNRAGGKLSVVAESPTHLGAVETVGGRIRAHVLGARFIALPPTLEVPAELIGELRTSGIKLADADGDAQPGQHERRIRLLAPLSEADLARVREHWLPLELRGARRESRKRRWDVVEEDLKAAARVLERARPCPTPFCEGAGVLDAEADRVVISCGRCDGRWGMQRCSKGHPVPFALAGDDAVLLKERNAAVEESPGLLGLQLVQPIGVRDNRLGTTCRVCAGWTWLPFVAHES